jgi:hypothetical protein
LVSHFDEHVVRVFEGRMLKRSCEGMKRKLQDDLKKFCAGKKKYAKSQQCWLFMMQRSH